MVRPLLALPAVVCCLWLGACSRTGLDVHGTAHDKSGGTLSATSSAGTGGAGSGGASATTPTSATDAGRDGPADATPEAAAADGCLLAIRTDVCCSDPFVISQYEMDEDPCIQPYLQPTYLPECMARRPSRCELIDCAFTPPLTRVVVRGPDGTCQYFSECETTADCVRASDLRQCCGCPYVYPRALVETDGCLQDPTTTIE